MVKQRAQDVRDEDIADELIKKALGEKGYGADTRLQSGRDRISIKEMARIKIRDISFRGQTINKYPGQDMKTKMGRKITYMKQQIKNLDRIINAVLSDVTEYRLTHPNAIIWIQINNALQPNLDRLESQIQDYIPKFAIPHYKKMFKKIFEHLAVICEADNFPRSLGLMVLCTIADVFDEKEAQRAEDIALLEKFLIDHPTHEGRAMVEAKLHNLKARTWRQEMIEYTHQENVDILANMPKVDRDAGERRARERLVKEKEDGKR